MSKCFRCSQQGHLSNECPQRKTLAIEDGQEDDVSDDNIYEISTPKEGDQLSCGVQRILFTLTTDRIPQRNFLFRTICSINNKVCQVITDSGGSENLKTKPHLNP